MEKKKQIIFYAELVALVLYIVAHYSSWEKEVSAAAAIIMMGCGAFSLTMWKSISWFQRACNISIIAISIMIIALILQ